MRIMERGLASVGLFCVASTVFAAPPQGARATAQLSTGVARPGEQAVISLVVVDAKAARLIQVPEVAGLSLGRPQGPNRSEFTRIVNNRRSHQIQLAWTLSVLGTEVGDYEIPPFVLEVDGQRMETQPLDLKIRADIRGEDLGFLSIRPSTKKVVEGQPFTLELRFGWEASERFNFASLSLPWWDSIPGAVELEQAPLPPGANIIDGVQVNDRHEIKVEELASSGGRRNFRVTKSFLPTRSGPIEFPTSFFEFGRISDSRRFPFGGRQKVASHFVRADPFALEVIPLPTEGQPFDYGGAVGTLTARASADTRDVVVGDSIKLTVEWSGSGNLEFFDPPDIGLLEDFRDFRVYGSTEEKRFDQRRVTYDLAPLNPDVTEIPSVPLEVFDPEAEAYTTVVSDPIAIRVRPLERELALGEETEDRFEDDILDIETTPVRSLSQASEGPENRLLAAGLLAVPLFYLGGRATVRRRRGDPDAPLERRRRRARRRLAGRLRRAAGPEGALVAFTAFLAERTREPAQAWMGRDVGAWAETTDVVLEDEAVEELQRLLTRLEGAVYGAGVVVPVTEILSTADRLKRAGL